MSLFDLTLLFFFALVTIKAAMDFRAFWRESDALYSIEVRQQARRACVNKPRVVRQSYMNAHPRHIPAPCRPSRMPSGKVVSIRQRPSRQTSIGKSHPHINRPAA